MSCKDNGHERWKLVTPCVLEGVKEHEQACWWPSRQWGCVEPLHLSMSAKFRNALGRFL